MSQDQSLKKPAADASAAGKTGIWAGLSPVKQAVIATVFLADFAWWLWIWRNPIWMKDDLLFVARSWDANHNFDIGAWLAKIPFDLGERNGRIADIFGELIFQSGPPLGVIMAMISVAFSVGLFFLGLELMGELRWPMRSRWFVPAFAIFATMLPFVVEVVAPGMVGSTYLFMSAAVGYLGGMALLAVLLALYLRALRRGLQWKDLAWFIPLLVLVVLFHEGLALVTFGVTVVMPSAVGRAAWSARFWTFNSLLGLLSVGRFALPGMWARREIMSEGDYKQELPSLQRLLVGAVTSVGEVSASMRSLELVLNAGNTVFLVLAGVLLWRSAAASRKIRVVYWAGVIINLGCLVPGMYLSRRFILGLKSVGEDTGAALTLATSKSTHLAELLLGFAGVAFLICVVLLAGVPAWHLAGLAAVLPMFAWGIGAATGIGSGRPMFFFAAFQVFVLVVMLAALIDAAGDSGLRGAGFLAKAGASVLVLVLVAGAGLAGREMWRTHVAVSQNIPAWNALVAQVEAAHPGQSEPIVIHEVLPACRYALNYYGFSPDFHEKLLVAHGLPKRSVPFQVVK